jgi:hypothetical protein
MEKVRAIYFAKALNNCMWLVIQAFFKVIHQQLQRAAGKVITKFELT